ncbi:GntR family transcriptional regulator [Sneathiella sedimenti]|uniref:GntR family transcriptional regulator n=1 Tax=Sneathiella sedimenti TaxID=2816034 RepID=UPI0030806B9E
MKSNSKTEQRAKQSGKTKISLGQKISDTLKRRILNWEYPPNTLLVEEELSEEFGVSRSPVREALQMLESAGLAERRKNRSFVVKQVRFEEVRDIYEFREAIELYVIERLCVLEQRQAGLKALKVQWLDIQKSHEAGVDPEPAKAALLDQDFHEGLAELLGNKVILNALRSLSERLLFFRTIDFQRDGRIGETCREHLEIIDAIEKGNIEMARRCLLENIDGGLQNVQYGLQVALMRSHS